MAKRRQATVEVLPSAKRLIGSLRDVGYETAEAVADLIDNSIAAGATRVDVTLHFDGGASWLRIADNGGGMGGAEITEAMKYGAQRRYEDDDLGKFGLGLKTASMSQCRRLSVASRVAEVRARVQARQLDLDYVEETDSWRVLILAPSDRPTELVDPLKRSPGTVVLWEDLDRILNYKNPGSEWARTKLLNLAEQLDLHLGMVFHKFLAGDVPGRPKLKITLNGTTIEPWDPFARGEEQTRTLKPQEFEIHTSSGSGIVRLEPFILPPKDAFSTDAAHRRASGPNNWNRQQGFYIYRAHRLIQSGGWSRMRTQDEHSKLARIGLYFSPDLDAALGINVAKMRVLLPAELKDQIKPTVDQVVKQAVVVYRGKPEAAARPRAGGSAPTPSPSPTKAGPTGSTSQSPGSNGQGGVGSGAAFRTVAELRREALEAAADTAKEGDALQRIVSELHKINPAVAEDLGY